MSFYLAQPYELQPKTIWDGGHGVDTQGKRSADVDGDGHADMLENEFNDALVARLNMAHSLNGLLSETTSTVHQDVSLRQRVSFANQVHRKHLGQTGMPTFFVSLHADSFNDPSVSGRKIFVSPNASQWSQALARFLDGYLHHEADLKIMRRPISSGVHTANFYVLRKTIMPAILIECGFMTNEHDRNLMMQETYRNYLSYHISLGIKLFYQHNNLLR